MTHLTDPAPSTPAEILATAAQAALRAPSVFNTQPWRWHVDGDTMVLRADRERALTATDPDGRLLLLSCGAALHHARVALAAAGFHATVERLPDAADPDLLARLTFTGVRPADPAAERLAVAVPHRRTDRRAYGSRPVTETQLSALRRVVEAEGAYLHTVDRDQLPMLAISTELAGDAELQDPDYRDELDRWTHRPVEAGDGVPVTTAVAAATRRVPVRDFAPDGDAGLRAGQGYDAGSAFVILFGLTDRAADFLRGGEALSALLLTATAEGMATEPISDSIEVAWPRHLLRGLLSGIGEPYVAVRLGYADVDTPVPPAPRRAAADVIHRTGD
ncbi:nitroreductase [Actinoplanes sp. N902-109]|uniref:Acg family FMN-binding oxidoreductase n=1 Tax=Actinoplanes sp. (strain N902-109) TaxID=649831 RepID=UPI000329554C|nr:nitroreductase [Actinoplanes sp. N902-109]AGL18243.1 nitroreductase [Actinoplanes sp. N902-109]